MPYQKSPAVARQLGLLTQTLLSWVRTGRMPPPGKDSSGHYFWTEADIENAKVAKGIDRRRKAAKAS